MIVYLVLGTMSVLVGVKAWELGASFNLLLAEAVGLLAFVAAETVALLTTSWFMELAAWAGRR